MCGAIFQRPKAAANKICGRIAHPNQHQGEKQELRSDDIDSVQANDGAERKNHEDQSRRADRNGCEYFRERTRRLPSAIDRDTQNETRTEPDSIVTRGRAVEQIAADA